MAADSAVTVLAGTSKGLFMLRDGDIRGPMLAGDQVYSVARDQRRGRLLAGALSMHWGPQLRSSDDGGATWRDPDPSRGLRFPADAQASLRAIWQLELGVDGQPDLIYAGVEPAALFRSADGGDTFELLRGLWDHPHRPMWQPGGGGLCLHSILVDPRDSDRLYIAVSAAGVYRSDDAGTTWQGRNAGVRAAGGPRAVP